MNWHNIHSQWYRNAIILVVVIVGILLIESFNRKPESLNQASQISPQDTSEGGGNSSAADNAEIASQKALFDPDDPATADKYRLPETLNTQQAQDLIARLNTLQSLLAVEQSISTETYAARTAIDNDGVKQALFARVSEGAGFKYKELPYRWSEFSNAALAPAIVRELNEFRFDDITGRVERVKGHILDGRFVRGDSQFVEFWTQHLLQDADALLPSLAKARQMERWLVDDGIITSQAAASGFDLDIPTAAELEANTKSGQIAKNVVDGVVQTAGDTTPLPDVATMRQEYSQSKAEIDFYYRRVAANRSRREIISGLRDAVLQLNRPDVSDAWKKVVDVPGPLDEAFDALQNPPEGLVSGQVTLVEKSKFSRAFKRLYELTEQAKKQRDLQMHFVDLVRGTEGFMFPFGPTSEDRYRLFGNHLGDQAKYNDPPDVP